MKKLMILGASILQLPAIKKAIELGLQVVVVDMNPNAVGFLEDGIIKEIISTTDTNAVLEAAKKHCIDGIMTLASDMPMQTVAKVSKELGLIGVDEDTALKATNKAEMRKVLEEYDVPIPKYYRVEELDEFEKAVNIVLSLGFKCIVKPADNSGSRGVCLIDSNEIGALEEIYSYCKNSSRSGTILVEEYMEGPEVSVETISIDGVCHVIQITDKLTTGAPYFVEMGHSQPSLLDRDIQKEIERVTIAANNAIGIKEGPSHTELKVTKQGPKIIEIGARLGGDNITTHLVPLSTGVDMVECCIKIALGEKPDIKQKYLKGSAIRYFKVSKGLIVGVEGIEEIENVKGIKQISIVHNVGDYANEIKSSVDRIGYVIAQSDTAQQAINMCETACNKISIVTTK